MPRQRIVFTDAAVATDGSDLRDLCTRVAHNSSLSFVILYVYTLTHGSQLPLSVPLYCDGRFDGGVRLIIMNVDIVISKGENIIDFWV